MTAEKQALRQALLAKRRSLTPAVMVAKSKQIFAQLVKLPQYMDSKLIMCYAAMKDEVQTYDIMEHALNANKSVCIPQIVAAGQMNAVLVQQLGDLVPGKFSILTVRADNAQCVDPGKLDCILVPGVAFDREGHRLGMGAGFYDRFLPNTNNPLVIGLAFTCQLSELIPVMSHDCLVDYVITEAGILNCKTGKM